jgi:tetratricopeptide (TPR) repeat protein
MPTRQIKITVDKEQVLRTNTVPSDKAHLIEDSIVFSVQGNYLSKSDLAILDMLANNNWNRPVYFDLSVVQTSNIKLENYLQNEGFAYRFLPIKSNSLDSSIDTDILYSRLMDQFSWGNIGSPKIHIDDNLHRTTEIVRLKRNFFLLAGALIGEGKNEKALQVLDKVYEILPLSRYYTSYNDVALANAYHQIQANDKAEQVLLQVAVNALDKIDFYLSLGSSYIAYYEREMNVEMSMVKEVMNLSQRMELIDLYEKIETRLDVATSAYKQ